MTDRLRQRARITLDRLRSELLEARTDDGHWIGRLSASALSTATAVSAMSAVLVHSSRPPLSRDKLADLISRGIDALQRQQNPDGGFGDTDRSHSNIATSYLVLAASTLGQRAIGRSLPPDQVSSLERYIEDSGAFDALRARYGTDKTFVVPILTNLAIAGLVDWDEIPALPFEAAVFPQSMYRLLRMPVVSYAIPALVAIGQARHFHGRRAFFPLRWIRAASIHRTMGVLRRMQPTSGGYLEATPLTSFVIMSLAATGRSDDEVCRRGLSFLIESVSDEGSWPIDTNLATWVSSLSMLALSCDPEDDGSWCTPELIRWHLSCQHQQRHPFTGAEPGGWGWSDLSGAVPDSDDTPAAILALGRALKWQPQEQDVVLAAMRSGAGWLRCLQNRDGGWPTFCRGWGKLPFDRSSNDLTAHAIRALGVADRRIGEDPATSMRILKRAKSFLIRNQRGDGSWLPLWFGNQDREDESNPIYGTSRVLVASAALLGSEAVDRGCDYLVSVQNEDGGWGGGQSLTAWLAGKHEEKTGEVTTREARDPMGGSQPAKITSSVEETALAIEALVTVLWSRRNHLVADGVQQGVDSHLSRRNEGVSRPVPEPAISDDEVRKLELLDPDAQSGGTSPLAVAIIRGVEFLLDAVDENQHHVAWPIGFYFAKLWYYERLYPLIFATTALGKYLRATAGRDSDSADWPP